MDRADHATACRAGAAAAGAPVRRRRLSAVCRPAGQAAHATGIRAGADAPDRRSRLRTTRRTVGRRGLRVRARGRGPVPTFALSTAASGPQQTPSRAPGTGPRLHCQPTWPVVAYTTWPGPAAGSRLRLSAGPGRSPVSGAARRQTPCRRCRQSGRRGPAVRQVWGTDSDTSWRRRGRRSRPAPRPRRARTRTGRLGMMTLQRPPARAGFPAPFRFCRGCPLHRVTCAPVVQL